MSYRKVIQNDYGDPAEVLELRRIPDPVLSPGQVGVRMETAALHIADLYNIRGSHGFHPPLPRTPGYEGVGMVDAVGPGVSSEWIGRRVFAPLGSGTLTEVLIADVDDLLPAPAGDSRQLALTVVNGATAITLLDDFVPLKQGEWLIQNAANSNVGRYVIVLARERGIRTVNVVRRPELIPELAELGGDVVLLDGADLSQRVNSATDGAGIRMGFDAVAGEATARLADCLGEGGLVVNYGAVTRENGSSIEGLYAAGRTAVGVCSGANFSGLSIADTVFSGRRAASAALKRGSA